jgi:hypothetical protein
MKLKPWGYSLYNTFFSSIEYIARAYPALSKTLEVSIYSNSFIGSKL